MGTIVRWDSSDHTDAPHLRIHSEQWRYTGPFTRFNRFKGSFPGLGIATVAFAGYLAAEQFLWKDEHAHHDEGHH
jgi:NADH dehydrogenase (ubiquinone) 1 beta subcomplex subunit 3